MNITLKLTTEEQNKLKRLIEFLKNYGYRFKTASEVIKFAIRETLEEFDNRETRKIVFSLLECPLNDPEYDKLLIKLKSKLQCNVETENNKLILIIQGLLDYGDIIELEKSLRLEWIGYDEEKTQYCGADHIYEECNCTHVLIFGQEKETHSNEIQIAIKDFIKTNKMINSLNEQLKRVEHDTDVINSELMILNEVVFKLKVWIVQELQKFLKIQGMIQIHEICGSFLLSMPKGSLTDNKINELSDFIGLKVYDAKKNKKYLTVKFEVMEGV